LTAATSPAAFSSTGVQALEAVQDGQHLLQPGRGVEQSFSVITVSATCGVILQGAGGARRAAAGAWP